MQAGRTALVADRTDVQAGRTAFQANWSAVQADRAVAQTDRTVVQLQAGRTVVQVDRTAVQQALVCLFVCCMDPSTQQTNKHTKDRFAPAWRHVGMRGQPLVCLCVCCMDTSRQIELLPRGSESSPGAQNLAQGLRI